MTDMTDIVPVVIRVLMCIKDTSHQYKYGTLQRCDIKVIKSVINISDMTDIRIIKAIMDISNMTDFTIIRSDFSLVSRTIIDTTNRMDIVPSKAVGDIIDLPVIKAF
jgi:hypothetical protein